MEFILLAFALILIGIAILFYKQATQLKRHGFFTHGRVVKIVGEWVRAGGKQQHYHFPVVRFKDAARQVVERKMESGGSPPLIPAVGDELEIIYHEGKVYSIDQGKPIYSLLFLILGVVALGILLFSYWKNS